MKRKRGRQTASQEVVGGNKQSHRISIINFAIKYRTLSRANTYNKSLRPLPVAGKLFYDGRLALYLIYVE